LADPIFKKVFADSHNLAPLRSFLSSVLDVPQDDLVDLTLLPTHLTQSHAADKEGIVDVRVRTKSGRDIDIEVQRFREPGFRQRLVYYGARMLSGQLHSGEQYQDMAQAIVIAIADFPVTSCPIGQFHHRFRLHDKSHNLDLSDIMEIDVLELPKLTHTTDDTLLYKWLRFFTARNREELDMAATLDPEIANAVDTVHFFSEEESAQILELRHEMAMHDRASWEWAARNPELAAKELSDDVEHITRVSIARGLIAKGIDPDMITDVTGVPVEELRKY
jgi:predicted transposase/invertase (TIGR01784 family)